MGRVRGEVRDNWEQRRGAVPRGRREASLDEGGAATWSPKAGPPCLSFQGKPCAFNPRVGVRQKRAASCGFRSELGALGWMNQRWDCLPLGRRFPALHSPVCTPLWWPFWALCKPGVSLARRSRSVLPPGDTRGSRGGRRRAAGTCCCDSRALPAVTPQRCRCAQQQQVDSTFILSRSSREQPHRSAPRSGWPSARGQGAWRCSGGFNPGCQTRGLTGPLSIQGSRPSLRVTALRALGTPSVLTAPGPEPDSGPTASPMGAQNGTSFGKAVHQFRIQWNTHLPTDRCAA